MRSHYFAHHDFYYGDEINNFMELSREREREFSIQKCDFKVGLKLTVSKLTDQKHEHKN